MIQEIKDKKIPCLRVYDSRINIRKRMHKILTKFMYKDMTFTGVFFTWKSNNTLKSATLTQN